MQKTDKYDFKPIGKAIKKARLAKGWTQEQLAQKANLSPRYLVTIENNGQHPSFQTFVSLMQCLNISVDQFFFPDEKSSTHYQLDVELSNLDDRDLTVLLGTIGGLKEAKKLG